MFHKSHHSCAEKKESKIHTKEVGSYIISEARWITISATEIHTGSH